VARLFDKDQSIARPVDLLLPFNSDNPPPSVRVTVILIILQPITDISCWLVFQDLYPDCEVDRSCPMRMIEPTGDDVEGEGAPSVETLAPNPSRSSVAEESRPSAADQTTSTAPLGDSQKKKCVVLGTKHKQDKTVIDQVIIELPPYRGPQSHLDLVDVDHIFLYLFEAF
jgi:hypothetical protein